MKALYIPDGREEKEALARTTHLCVAAHEDDIEFMAYAPISECYGREDKWFCGVVVTDGAGSPRKGPYAAYSDGQMKEVRAEEQKRAAKLGGYGAQFLLGYTSAEVKDGANQTIAAELAELLRKTSPKVVYTHNLADKHKTHVATALKTIQALRMLDEGELPERVYGCEVWRDLDWLNDGEKVYLDCSSRPELARALSAVFESQILGGKRYDAAAEGRRLAHATFSESHACDRYAMLNYAMDLTPLVLDRTLDIAEYVTGYIERFKQEVTETIGGLL